MLRKRGGGCVEHQDGVDRPGDGEVAGKGARRT